MIGVTAVPLPSSTSWTAALAGVAAADAVVCRRASWSSAGGGAPSHEACVQQAEKTLGPAEQMIWSRLGTLPRRRSEWLLGRIAAKHAVLQLIRDHAGLSLAPDAVEIVADGWGRPIVQASGCASSGVAPVVTISHSQGVAVALAAMHPGLAVGIDIEQRERRSRFAEAAFTAAERRLLADLAAPEREQWHLRLWCAKEAAGKALGRGLADGPHALAVVAVQFEAGLVQLRLEGSLRAAVNPPSRDLILVAHTTLATDCVCALVLHRDKSQPGDLLNRRRQPVGGHQRKSARRLNRGHGDR